MDKLPIESLLPALSRELSGHCAVVVTAPPGAGKTTRLPLALDDSGQIDGTILVAQPRRLAARAVARRMAHVRGEQVGRSVGYRVRFDDRSSKATRILVVTQGILLRWLLSDPLLEGVGCVLLDEFHERSADLDLALAFLKEVLEVRDDLKLIVMSATLEPEPLQRYLGDCPLLTCSVRSHPVEVQHAASADDRPLPEAVRAGLVRLLQHPDDDAGDLLAFLPGAPEIRRTMDLLKERPLPGCPEVVPLFGALGADQQDRALRPGTARRVVLATNIAETSLTVPGVTAVVDSGLVKRPVNDPRIGLDRLSLGRISRASAEQRAGRAGRIAPGRVLRLWTVAEHAGFAPMEVPEIARCDLASVVLGALAFRPGPLEEFPFFEAPPGAALEAALELLDLLGAIGPEGHGLSDPGKHMADLPLHPRLSAMLLAAGRWGALEDGALLAALLGAPELLARQRGARVELPTGESDLVYRRDLFLELEEAGFGASDARRLGLDPGAAREVKQSRQQLSRLASRRVSHEPMAWGESGATAAKLVLAGFPDRVCRRRRPGHPEAVMHGGRGVRLAKESGVRESALFVALEADAGARGLHAVSLVRLASAVDLGDLEVMFPNRVHEVDVARFDADRRAVVGFRQTVFAGLVVEELAGVPVPPQAIAEALAPAALEHFSEIFKPDQGGIQLLARVRLAGRLLGDPSWPRMEEEDLRGILTELCHGRRSLEELSKVDWAAEVSTRLGWKRRKTLEAELPERVRVPSGRTVRIDYEPAILPGGEPVLAVKLQELFGLADTPRIAGGRLPLVLHLLAPNGRPVQVTRDLRSFWDRVYPEVRRDLRGRYPRHPWPEDPWKALPTARTKPRKR